MKRRSSSKYEVCLKSIETETTFTKGEQLRWLEMQFTPTASLQRGKTHHNECPEYDIKQSDGEILVQELRENVK